MRYFNTHGPVNPAEHYFVSRHALLLELVAQIESGKYFTIFAPRQMGKTTLLQQMEAELRARSGYLPISLSFERFEGWQVVDFMAEVADLIVYHLREALHSHPKIGEIEQLFQSPFTDARLFEYIFRSLHTVAPEIKIILIIDEFDATPQTAISALLQTWRAMYLSKRPRHSLHAVILLGIQNIARINLGRSSPFNIAYQHRLANFSLVQVDELLAQFTAETGQTFEAGVIEKIYEQTGGQPFLVNRLAAILTEEVATGRNLPVTLSDVRTALGRLVRESNYNFETVVRHAAEYQAEVTRILFGAQYAFTLNDPLINDLHLHGVIVEGEAGFCTVANPIYQRVLIDYFRPREMGLQAAILANGYDFRADVGDDILQMGRLLSRFREFIERRGREAFKVGPTPQEATGQYLLMAYLDLAVRQLGGDLFTEVSSGEGRLDLLVSHRNRRYVVETKLWRGALEFERGLDQLRRYLVSEGERVGYFVVFHALPKVYGKLAHEQLEFTVREQGATIYVFIVRLGRILDE